MTCIRHLSLSTEGRLVSGYIMPIEKRPITLQLISNALTSKHNLPGPGPVEMVSWMLTSLPESVFPANRVVMVHGTEIHRHILHDGARPRHWPWQVKQDVTMRSWQLFHQILMVEVSTGRAGWSGNQFHHQQFHHTLNAP